MPIFFVIGLTVMMLATIDPVFLLIGTPVLILGIGISQVNTCQFISRNGGRQ